MTPDYAAKLLSGLANYTAGGHSFIETSQAIAMAKTALHNQRANGNWVPDEYMRNFIKCDQCGYTTYKDVETLFAYCPVCGASMKGETT